MEYATMAMAALALLIFGGACCVLIYAVLGSPIKQIVRRVEQTRRDENKTLPNTLDKQSIGRGLRGSPGTWMINGEMITSFEHFREATQCSKALVVYLRLRYGNIK